MKQIRFNNKTILNESEVKLLLEKYFDGQTSDAEEELLRRYFALSVVPQEWEYIRPLFAYTTCQRAAKDKRQRTLSPPLLPKRILWGMSVASVAAAITLMIALRLPQTDDKTPLPTIGSYALVNGKRVNNPEEVRRYAMEAFNAVATDREELAKELFDL